MTEQQKKHDPVGRVRRYLTLAEGRTSLRAALPPLAVDALLLLIEGEQARIFGSMCEEERALLSEMGYPERS